MNEGRDNKLKKDKQLNRELLIPRESKRLNEEYWVQFIEPESS